MAVKKERAGTGWQEVWGILLLAAGVLVLFGMLSYDPGDVSALQSPPNDPPHNFIGPTGSWTAFVLLMAFGIGAYLVPVGMVAHGITMMLKREGRVWTKAVWILLIIFSIVSLAELQAELWQSAVDKLNIATPGGILGYFIAQRILISLLGEVGTAILASATLLIGIILLFEVRPVLFLYQLKELFDLLRSRISAFLDARRDEKAQLEKEERDTAKKRRALEKEMKQQEKAQRAAERRAQIEEMAARKKEEKAAAKAERAGKKEEEEPEPETPARKKLLSRTPKTTQEEIAPLNLPSTGGDYRLPSIDLLDRQVVTKASMDKNDLKAASLVLEETLAEFGIDAEVTNVEQGPVVTRYEVLPAAGVRVEKIVNLSNNIALAMKAETVRIQAPIPGKGVVGIEVPNSKASIVVLREIVESSTAWDTNKIALPLALGKDVGGKVIVSDLSEMPHLLIAGATGSGKTVCMNSILAGLLMSRTPDEMRLMLIDPKIVEFSGYNHMPHLVVPVITDPKKVSLGLRWAINEMEWRYKIFAKVGVRNIRAFNSRPVVTQTDMFSEDIDEEEEAKNRIPERLPYIVIVVDELADLMMVAQAEVENAIARLAQLSRAVGIHMILATQRPSVNVITGTIKANFPARIGFQVAQKVDSRTILDASGADKLLGKGDMLFLPPGSSKLIRAQGTLTTDQEITRIVAHVKQQGEPQYEIAIKERMESKTPSMEDSGAADDDMLESAIEVIRQTRRASTSSLQRRLRIGYTRAARLMDLMEERGIVGPPRGSDPREILIDLDGEIPENEADDS
ncbi:MAG: DNA translocase FtsK [Verrucomicrobia bacterium]|nr:DNA translocase FtsK [Verrucomicrobiota bacterium]